MAVDKEQWRRDIGRGRVKKDANVFKCLPGGSLKLLKH